MQNINTKSYWDRRFSEDWEARGGKGQSRFFSKIALESFPIWLTTYLKKNDISFCDWGCAHGDGTKVLKQQLQIKNVVGIDISSNAIEEAKLQYPDINFEAANFILESPKQSFDIIFSSNTLEHFEDPWQVTKVLSSITKKHLIILIPFEEQGAIEEEHYYSFNLTNIPQTLDSNLSLSFYKIIDTSKATPSYWNGKQILLIYSSNVAITELNLTISEIQTPDKSNITEKEFMPETYKDHIKSLESLLESHSQLAKKNTNNFTEHCTTFQSLLKDTTKSISILNNLISVMAEHQLKVLNNLSNSNTQFEEIQRLQTLLSKKEIETQEYKEQIKLTLAEFDNAKIELNTAKIDLEKAFKEIDTISNHSGELTSSNLKLNSLLLKKNEYINNLETSFTLIKERLATKETEIEHFNTESKTLTQKTTELDKKLLEKQIELNNVYDKYGILSSRFYELLNSKSWRFTNYIRLPIYLLKKKIGLLKADIDLSVPDLKATTNKVAPEPITSGNTYTSKISNLLNNNKDHIKHQVISHNAVSEKKNIILLVQEFVEGGLERVVLDLAIRLKKENFNTAIFVAGKSGGWLSKEATHDGISIFEFNNNTTGLSAYLNKTKVDILLINHCYFGLDEFKKQNIPVIEIIHNVYFWQKNNLAFEALRSKFIDKYIAVSKAVFDYSAKYLKIPPEKIEIINNGLNTKGFYRPHIQIIEKLRTKLNKEFIFIHLAAIRPSKCHTTVLSAFKVLKSKYPFIKLWFAGNIDDPKLFSYLTDCITKESLNNDIQYLGTLNRKELSEKLLKADAALLPSSYEGFSIASLEYMFFGLPQILTNVGAAQDIITTSDIGIVIEEPIMSDNLSNAIIDINGKTPSTSSVENLAVAMENMIKNREEWKKKGLTATYKIEQFMFNNVLDKYISSIKMTLND